jgi:hypothetical protein
VYSPGQTSTTDVDHQLVDRAPAGDRKRLRWRLALVEGVARATPARSSTAPPPR